MCPPSPAPLGDIGLCCTDNRIVLLLDKLIRGSPLPGDVLDDVNPYQNQPQHLPVDMWYLVNSIGPKESEYGFWNTKGDASEIFENSVLQGWKNTLEFFEGRAPYGRRTEWVMQEYSITRKGAQKDIQKQSRALCRVFQDWSSKVDKGSFSNSVPSLVRNISSSSGGGSTMESQKKSSTVSTRSPEVHKTENLSDEYVRDFLELNDLGEDTTRLTPEVSRIECTSDVDVLDGDYLELNDLNKDIRESPVVEKPEIPFDEDLADTFSRGDYLEMNDLVDFASLSSSSANSSPRKSDDFFALLQHLDDEKNQDKGSSFHCNFTGSERPNKVILQPPTSELLIHGTGISESPAETQPSSSAKAKSSYKAFKDPNVKRPKPDYRNEGSSNGSSSKRSKKKFKKYFCFLPF